MFRILLATDGSAGAARAARYAANLCAALKEPAATILFVKDFSSISLTPIASFTGFGGIAMRPDAIDWPTLVASLDEAATAALQAAKEAFAGMSEEVPLQLLTEVGKPWEVICHLAETKGFDLIVLGSRGLGGISGLLLGSVSNQVVHRSKVPVLVVH